MSDSEQIGDWVWWSLAILLSAGLCVLVFLLFTGPDDSDRAESERRGGSSSIVDGVLEAAGLRAPDSPSRTERAAGPHGIPITFFEEQDPQVLAMERTHAHRGDGGAAPSFDPVYHPARVTSVSGASPVSPGRECRVRLLPVRNSQFNCLVRVSCDDVILYPDGAQQAGYVPCSLDGRAVSSALDDGTTSADGDPIVQVDTVAGHVRVSDSGPGVATFEAQLDLI